MADPVADLAKADAEAALARARLKITLDRLQDRLEPRRLANDAKRQIADTASAAAQAASTTVRRNPVPLAGMVAAAGLFLARHRIAMLWKRKATRADPAR